MPIRTKNIKRKTKSEMKQQRFNTYINIKIVTYNLL